jgi:spore coat protein CotH
VLYNNREERYRGFETKYPDFEDVNPTDYSTLYNAIKFTLNSSDDAFLRDLDTYFDVPVLIDYYIYINFLVALDNNGKNMFWACYDKQENPKLTIGVWDLDCTIGQNYTDTDPHPSHFGPEVDMRASSMLNVIERMRQHPIYLDSIHQRYWELRQTHLHIDSLIARYESYFQLFQRGGAAYREEKRWSGDTDIAGLTLDFQQELEFIKDWIQRRLDFLDNGEFAKIDISTDVLSPVLQEGTANQYYNLLGVPVEYPKSGIYIKDRKKILIP